MTTMFTPRALAGAVTMIAASLLSAPDAGAQWGQRIGVGYVVSAPNQYIGVSGHVLTTWAGGLGLYVDGKVTRPTTTDRDNFQSDWTSRYVDDNFGDLPFNSEEEYVSVNLALMRPVTPELIVYAGAGLTRREVYVEYLDEQLERGTRGLYWVEDEEAAAEGMNLLGGAFFRIARNVSLQFGFETQPRGVTVGAAYSLSLGR